MRQKRKDKVHGCLVASDTDSPRFQAKGTEQQTTGITGGGLQKDATDTYGEKLQKWLKNNGREIEEENIARLDNGVERSCCIRAFADSDNERLSTIGITDRISSEEREKKRRCLMQYTSNDWPALSAERWKDFPTQPPVSVSYTHLDVYKRQDLKAKLDKEFSLFIRLRDAMLNGYFKCISCGQIKPFEQADNGHYINRQHMSTRFDEMNCNAQCRHCKDVYKRQG